MPNFFCNAPGCNSATKKYKQLKKYPWMKDVVFFSFPHKVRLKYLRKKWIFQLRRKEEKWKPNRFSRICSRHFVDGKPTELNPLPTLFKRNNYGKDPDPPLLSKVTLDDLLGSDSDESTKKESDTVKKKKKKDEELNNEGPRALVLSTLSYMAEFNAKNKSKNKSGAKDKEDGPTEPKRLKKNDCVAEIRIKNGEKETLVSIKPKSGDSKEVDKSAYMYPFERGHSELRKLLNQNSDEKTKKQGSVSDNVLGYRVQWFDPFTPKEVQSNKKDTIRRGECGKKKPLVMSSNEMKGVGVKENEASMDMINVKQESQDDVIETFGKANLLRNCIGTISKLSGSSDSDNDPFFLDESTGTFKEKIGSKKDEEEFISKDGDTREQHSNIPLKAKPVTGIECLDQSSREHWKDSTDGDVKETVGNNKGSKYDLNSLPTRYFGNSSDEDDLSLDDEALRLKRIEWRKIESDKFLRYIDDRWNQKFSTLKKEYEEKAKDVSVKWFDPEMNEVRRRSSKSKRSSGDVLNDKTGNKEDEILAAELSNSEEDCEQNQLKIKCLNTYTIKEGYSDVKEEQESCFYTTPEIKGMEKNDNETQSGNNAENNRYITIKSGELNETRKRNNGRSKKLSIKCKHCSYTASFIEDLVDHLELHNLPYFPRKIAKTQKPTTSMKGKQNTKKVCKFCSYKASTLEETQKHYQQYHQKTFFCLTCREKFFYYSCFQIHKMVAHSQRSDIVRCFCKTCAMWFRTPIHYASHMVYTHSRYTESEKIKKIIGANECREILSKCCYIMNLFLGKEAKEAEAAFPPKGNECNLMSPENNVVFQRKDYPIELYTKLLRIDNYKQNILFDTNLYKAEIEGDNCVNLESAVVGVSGTVIAPEASDLSDCHNLLDYLYETKEKKVPSSINKAQHSHKITEQNRRLTHYYVGKEGKLDQESINKNAMEDKHSNKPRSNNIEKEHNNHHMVWSVYSEDLPPRYYDDKVQREIYGNIVFNKSYVKISAKDQQNVLDYLKKQKFNPLPQMKCTVKKGLNQASPIKSWERKDSNQTSAMKCSEQKDNYELSLSTAKKDFKSTEVVQVDIELIDRYAGKYCSLEVKFRHLREWLSQQDKSDGIVRICPRCYYNTTNFKDYQSHLSEHLHKGLYCKLCNLLCTTSSNLIRHWLYHFKRCKTIIQCDSCLFVTNSKEELKQHMSNHYRLNNPWECTITDEQIEQLKSKLKKYA